LANIPLVVFLLLFLRLWYLYHTTGMSHPKIIMGIYAAQYTPVITRVHIAAVKAASLHVLAKENECGVSFCSRHPMNVLAHKSAAHHDLCCREFEPRSCTEANAVVLWAFLDNDADTPICYPSRVGEFAGDVSNVAPVSSNFSLARDFCVFSYCFKCNLLLENSSLCL